MALPETFRGRRLSCWHCARNDAEVKQAVSELEAHGVKVAGAAVDVASAESMQAWVDHCVATLGGVDIFVSNVSAGGADASEDGWRANFEVDMLATWRGVQQVTPHLEKSDAGNIVVISSTAALEAFAGAVPYRRGESGPTQLCRQLSRRIWRPKVFG